MKTNITIDRNKFTGLGLVSECVYSCAQVILQINKSDIFESSEIHKVVFPLKPNLNKINQSKFHMRLKCDFISNLPDNLIKK